MNTRQFLPLVEVRTKLSELLQMLSAKHTHGRDFHPFVWVAALFLLPSLAPPWIGNQVAKSHHEEELDREVVVENNIHIHVGMGGAAPPVLTPPHRQPGRGESCRGESPEPATDSEGSYSFGSWAASAAHGGPFSTFGVSVGRGGEKEQGKGTSRPAPAGPPAPRLDCPRGAAGAGLTERGGQRKFSATPQAADGAETRTRMNEQTANGRDSNGRRFRLYEIIIAALLAAFFAALIASSQRTANRVDALERKVDEKVAALERKVDEKVAALERKVDENSRQIAEVRVILAEMQATLNLIAGGLDIRVEPKEQAGPATTPSPSEQLATKDP